MTIKRTLSVSEEEEEFIWYHAYDLMGMVAANIEPDDPDGAIRLYKEVIEFTDHPRAHVNIGVLYAQNNDKDQACQHWEYVVNNEGKLNQFKSYQKERESAIDNLGIAKKPATKKSGCFIATAAFESQFTPEVTFLRRFRDCVLHSSRKGRTFIKVYYLLSPPIAKVISRSTVLKRASREILKPIIKFLGYLYPNQ